MNWLNIAILLVSIGVASDNLVLAELGGNILTGLRKEKFILILLFFFILQAEMMYLGNRIAMSAEVGLYGTRHVLAIIFLVFNIGLMCTKALTDTAENHVSFKVSEMLKLIFSTSVHVLIWSWAFHWLNLPENMLRLLLPLIVVFFSVGLFIGRKHDDGLLKVFRWLAIVLMITGTAMLYYKTV